jgi:hypothetical protein
MSINESKEFEAINQKTSERKVSAQAVCCSTEEIYRAKKSKATKKAIVFMVITLVALVATLLGITALEQIGWINATFRIVLMCAAGAAAMFKTGYFWHEIKN